MLVLFAVVAFWPNPVDQPVRGQLAIVLQLLQRHGFPQWFNYKLVEATANIVLFVPLGFVSALAFSQKRWWQIGALGVFISGSMELGQLLFLDSRFSSPADLMTNTSGTVIGALLSAWGLRKLEVRHPSAADL